MGRHNQGTGNSKFWAWALAAVVVLILIIVPQIISKGGG